MLRLSGIRHHYSTSAVLHGAREALSLERFEATQGEHWLVLGASGSGKTTFLNLCSGLLAPSAGEVEIGGQVLARLRGPELDRWRGCNVGIVPQKLHLVRSLNVLQNLLLAPYLAGLASDPEREMGLLETLPMK